MNTCICLCTCCCTCFLLPALCLLHLLAPCHAASFSPTYHLLPTTTATTHYTPHPLLPCPHTYLPTPAPTFPFPQLSWTRWWTWWVVSVGGGGSLSPFACTACTARSHCALSLISDPHPRRTLSFFILLFLSRDWSFVKLIDHSSVCYSDLFVIAIPNEEEK